MNEFCRIFTLATILLTLELSCNNPVKENTNKLNNKIMNLRKEMSDALICDAPNEKLSEQLNLFAHFIGEWNFDWTGFNKDGTTQKEKGEWLFSWILEGRAVQDVWIIPTRENRGKPGMPDGEYGSAIRFYSEKENAWKVTWVGPMKDRLSTFIAKKIGDEIVLEATNETEFQMKWIFSEIEENKFRWRCIISEDGENWNLTQEMLVKRK